MAFDIIFNMFDYKLPQNWSWKKLSDIATFIGGINYDKKDICSEGIRVFRGGNIQDGRLIPKEDDVFLPISYDNELNRIQKGDTCITASTGSVELLGKAATCFEDMGNTHIGAFLRIIRPKKSEYALFISALFQTDYYSSYIQKKCKGTSINNIRTDILADFTFPFPSEEDLPFVSRMYEIITKKILLNQSIHDSLQALAHQIYDYWFVQFDFPDANGHPYKSSGNAMHYNNELKREIPAGWEKATLLDIANYTNGLACQNFRPKDGDSILPVIKIKEMRDGYTSDTEVVSANIPESIKVYNGDILFSWSASLEVMQWAYGEGGLNQHIFKVTGKDGYPKSFFFYQILSYVDVFRRIAEARKTTMGHITQDHLKQSRIAVPKDKAILDQFESKVRPLMDKQVKLTEEITSLKSLRGFLLPMLMTGQLSIS